MIALEPVDVVGDLNRLRVEVAGVGAATAEREPVAGHADADVPGNQARDARPELRGGEVFGKRAVVEGADVGGAQRVEERRGGGVGVPQHGRMHGVGLPGAAQRQHILAVVGCRVVVARVQIAELQRLLVAERVINLADALVIGTVVGNAELDTAARIIGHRDVFEHVGGHRIDCASRQHVVHERCAQTDLSPAIAGGRGKRGEVTGTHRGRWHEADGDRGVRVFVRPLVAPEEEQLVFHDRAAQDAAILIALEAVAGGGERIPRVEAVVAHKAEHRPRVRVGA